MRSSTGQKMLRLKVQPLPWDEALPDYSGPALGLTSRRARRGGVYLPGYGSYGSPSIASPVV